MFLDREFVYGGVVLGMFNLVMVAWIATGVIRTVLRQRALENAWRVRMAHWRRQTEGSAE